RRLPPSWRPVQPRTLAGASVWRARHLQRLQLQARLQLPAPPPPPPRWSLYAPIGVLSTSNRKPPLRIPLRRVAEILTHPGQVEVVSPKRVDVLANERSDVAQRFVSNLVALGT